MIEPETVARSVGITEIPRLVAPHQTTFVVLEHLCNLGQQRKLDGKAVTVVAAVVRTDQLMEPHALHVGVLRKDILETVQVHIEALDRFGLSVTPFRQGQIAQLTVLGRIVIGSVDIEVDIDILLCKIAELAQQVRMDAVHTDRRVALSVALLLVIGDRVGQYRNLVFRAQPIDRRADLLDKGFHLCIAPVHPHAVDLQQQFLLGLIGRGGRRRSQRVGCNLGRAGDGQDQDHQKIQNPFHTHKRFSTGHFLPGSIPAGSDCIGLHIGGRGFRIFVLGKGSPAHLHQVGVHHTTHLRAVR